MYNPKEILAQIELFQRDGSINCSEWIEQNKFHEYHKIFIDLLTHNNEISISEKLLIICFMKQYKIYLYQDEAETVLPLLDYNELKNTTSQLIVKSFDIKNFYEFLKKVSSKNSFSFIILVNTFIEMFDFDNNSYFLIPFIISTLQFFVQNDPTIHYESIKCLISLSLACDQKIQEFQTIISFLWEYFIASPINNENIKIFFSILQQRFNLEKISSNIFYQKIFLISKFVSDKGPPKDIDQSTFDYYLSQMILHCIEINRNNISNVPYQELILILLFFTVYHDDQIETWEYSIEEFFSSNEIYLLPKNKQFEDQLQQKEDDESLFYKESYQLQQFIYSEIIRLGDIQIDQSTNLLSFVVSTCASIIWPNKRLNYNESLIKISILCFFMHIEQVIPINEAFLSSIQDDLTRIYFILYCSKKKIIPNNISLILEGFLSQKREMYGLLVASILINYNTDKINPLLYSQCFEQCLQTLLSFDTENCDGVMKLLVLLADFENKPFIVPGFCNIIGNIMDYLVKTLILFQNAYQSTVSLCNLIAHFIRYIPFQAELLPKFINLIGNLCLSPNFANLGIKLEYAILSCKSAQSSFTDEQIGLLNQEFAKHIQFFNPEFLIDNPSTIFTILLISNFFAKRSVINVVDEWVFTFLQVSQIPSKYFDKISPVVISLIKNNNSKHRFEILKTMIERTENLPINNDDNPLLFPTIAVLAHLSIDNPDDLKRLIVEQFKYDFDIILTKINIAYNSKHDLNLNDSRLILVMMAIYGNHKIIVNEKNERTSLSLVNQFNTKIFFEKVAQLFSENQLNEREKSLFIDNDDMIFSCNYMKCSYLDLLNMLIPHPSCPEIEQFKANCIQFLTQRNL